MIYVSLKPMTGEAFSPLLKEFPDLPPLPLRKLEAPRIDFPTRRLAALVLARTLLFRSGLYPQDKVCLAKIRHLETGQPFLEIPGEASPLPSLSVSHSGGWIGCIIGDPSSPIGLDIEDMTLSRSLDKIADHAFFEEEKTLLKRDEKIGFYKAWGAKEAIAKCFGKGLAKALSINTGAMAQGTEVVVNGVSYSLQQDIIEREIFISIAQQTKKKQEIHFLKI